MPQGVSVCIFAGHSGGHLFPALAFAERFRKKFPESRITLLTSPKARPILASLDPRTAEAFDRIEYLNEFPFSSGISLRTFRFLLEFIRAFLLSFQYLSQLKPDLCVGFGSYVSYPGMKLAVWKKIPTLIHEQNKIAGKATRMLARHVDGVALSFPRDFSGNPESGSPTKTFGDDREFIVGLPIRSQLVQAARHFQRSFEVPSVQKPLRIMITGGSQGAHRLNEVILESFSLLLPEERKKIAVTHITGNKDFDKVTESYRRLGMPFKTFPFYDKMHELYQEADLAMTRAGANTLFELALFGLPAVVIPFPFTADSHQDANAGYFESHRGICVKSEKELTPQGLKNKILELSSPEIRKHYSESLSRMVPQDAASRLVEIASELIHLSCHPEERSDEGSEILRCAQNDKKGV